MGHWYDHYFSITAGFFFLKKVEYDRDTPFGNFRHVLTFAVNQLYMYWIVHLKLC